MHIEQDNFAKTYGVSQETIHNLSTYQEMLVEWNERINLVSASTLPMIWNRHFSDSAQLFQYTPSSAKTLADMGAGAGFPGLVLAIMAKGEGRNLHITEIEATNKKADFLQAVVDRLGLNVTIRHDRIEDIRDLKVDIITARALKALPELLKYANYLTKTDSICIFPKGQNAAEELTEARKKWIFKETIHPSQSDDSGSILVLKNLRYKT